MSLIRLTRWFKSHCNGEMEHSHGIDIKTMDNPCWWVEIDIPNPGMATFKLEKAPVGMAMEYHPETQKLTATCELHQLEYLLCIICDWLEKNAAKEKV